MGDCVMSHDTDGIRSVGKGGELEFRIQALHLPGLEEIRRWITLDSGDEYDKSSSISFSVLYVPCLIGVRKYHDTHCHPDDSFRRILSRRLLWSSLPISATDSLLSFSLPSSSPP